MNSAPLYQTEAPSRAELDQLPGLTLVEFGASWCGICQGAQGLLNEALEPHHGLRHLRIEDGPGRPLGRSFKVKLWPSLILLKDGVELARVVRPARTEDLRELLALAQGEAG